MRCPEELICCLLLLLVAFGVGCKFEERYLKKEIVSANSMCVAYKKKFPKNCKKWGC